jgi:hypothetical protein
LKVEGCMLCKLLNDSLLWLPLLRVAGPQGLILRGTPSPLDLA